MSCGSCVTVSSRLRAPLGVDYKSLAINALQYSNPRRLLYVEHDCSLFIVDDLASTLAFYQSKLGFEVRL